MAVLTLNFNSDVLTQQQLDDVVDYLIGTYFPDGFPDDFNPFLAALKNWYLVGTGSGAGFYEYSILPGASSPSLKDQNSSKFLLRLSKLTS
jgi:hypothetical protein